MMQNISKNISYLEATKSQTATRLGINNHPRSSVLWSMEYVADHIFQPIREHFGVPIYISSFYRSIALNTAIGGSSRSQHCKGEAIDIDADLFGGVKNSQLFDFVRDELTWDQLIWEFGNEFQPNWVHISRKSAGNRSMILRAIRVNGKVSYQNYDG